MLWLQMGIENKHKNITIAWKWKCLSDLYNFGYLKDAVENKIKSKIQGKKIQT